MIVNGRQVWVVACMISALCVLFYLVGYNNGVSTAQAYFNDWFSAKVSDGGIIVLRSLTP